MNLPATPMYYEYWCKEIMNKVHKGKWNIDEGNVDSESLLDLCADSKFVTKKKVIVESLDGFLKENHITRFFEP